MPFSVRNLELDERQVKLGLTECLKHELLEVCFCLIVVVVVGGGGSVICFCKFS